MQVWHIAGQLTSAGHVADCSDILHRHADVSVLSNQQYKRTAVSVHFYIIMVAKHSILLHCRADFGTAAHK